MKSFDGIGERGIRFWRIIIEHDEEEERLGETAFPDAVHFADCPARFQTTWNPSGPNPESSKPGNFQLLDYY